MPPSSVSSWISPTLKETMQIPVPLWKNVLVQNINSHDGVWCPFYLLCQTTARETFFIQMIVWNKISETIPTLSELTASLTVYRSILSVSVSVCVCVCVWRIVGVLMCVCNHMNHTSELANKSRLPQALVMMGSSST